MRLYLSSFRLGNRPDELIKLLNGKRRTALVANATDSLEISERADSVAQEIERLKSIGLEPAEIDLRDYFRKRGNLRETFLNFDLIWVRGGNTFVLRRAIHQSGADNLIKEMLANDSLVYGGYSAGIDILTPSLHGVEFVDDPNVVPDGYDPEIIWDCLGILPYAVAPHYRSAHPESAATEKSVEYLIDNHMLFRALRDGEAIVRKGDTEWVVC
jgi:dipeptidase E